MKSLYAIPHVARLVLGTLAALVLLAAVSAAAASTPLTSDQFAPGWQAHARSLFNQGITPRVPGRVKWYVPAILPPGEYVVVRREGDKAEVMPGVRFTVRDGIVDQYLFLPPGAGDLQALPVADVPALNAAPRAAALK